MPVFITAVLAAAALQSCCKLSLLNRWWQFLFLMLLIFTVFMTSDRAESASLQEFRTMLNDPETLNELCGLVIIQEFANIIWGFSLLGCERVPEKWSNRIFHWVKYLTFMPSILLFYGIWYGQMFLFNTFIEYSFSHLSLVTAMVLPVAALVLMELMRLIFRERDRRILAVMHLEFLLVVPSVFLPVAADAELISEPAENFTPDALIMLGISGVIVIISSLIFTIYNKNKYRKALSCHK